MGKIRYVGKLYDNTYCVGVHTHDMWEVVYYTDGEGEVNANGRLIPFAAHDIFVIPPNMPHTDYSDRGFRNYHYTFWDPDFPFGAFSVLKMQDSTHHDFLHIVEQLYTEYHVHRQNCERILDSLYAVLLQYMLSFLEEEPSNPYVSAMIDDIISGLTDPKYDLAAAIHRIPLHTDYFRRLFVRETGKTPLRYLTEKRIDYACRLLSSRKYSRLSVKEIAWRSGFEDAYYFSRVFKKLVGVAPGAWKESS